MGYFWDNWALKDDDLDSWLSKDTKDLSQNDYMKIFLGSTVVVGIISLLFYLIFVAGVHKKIKILNWEKTVS